MHQCYSVEDYNPSHIQDIYNTLNHSLAKYKRVTLFRFDVHIPFVDLDDPRIYRVTQFTKAFLGSLNAKLKSMTGKTVDFNYIWCKEHNVTSGASMQHYHFALIMDGNHFRSWGNYNYQGSSLKRCIEEAWASALDYPIEDCKRGIQFASTVTIDSYANRDCTEKYNEAVKMLSYLAKRYSKIQGQRCWGKSAQSYNR
ncbi:inovirus Gp2 family protein [Vibrio sp. S11_S32]|uniref:YagK/YfjJ domain-containing protein n=1 Tax=Vibrio sp. S11_S32 TaxID=2720225 RepID=UPI0016808B9B|nr:inovirus-type Gp2 protein [Vibrio sp. S11_S32]MBD1576781.1 inovirus Gp2 family protein [Vibrio sp. S11_S32]